MSASRYRLPREEDIHGKVRWLQACGGPLVRVWNSEIGRRLSPEDRAAKGLAILSGKALALANQAYDGEAAWPHLRQICKRISELPSGLKEGPGGLASGRRAKRP